MRNHELARVVLHLTICLICTAPLNVTLLPRFPSESQTTLLDLTDPPRPQDSHTPHHTILLPRSPSAAHVISVNHHRTNPENDKNETLRIRARMQERERESCLLVLNLVSSTLHLYLNIYIHTLVRGWGSTSQLFGVAGTLLCFFSIYLWASRVNLVGFKTILQQLRLHNGVA